MGKAVLNDESLRREALQICLQLPADRAEALAVLDYAEHLIRTFLHPSDAAAGVVVPLVPLAPLKAL